MAPINVVQEDGSTKQYPPPRKIRIDFIAAERPELHEQAVHTLGQLLAWMGRQGSAFSVDIWDGDLQVMKDGEQVNAEAELLRCAEDGCPECSKAVAEASLAAMESKVAEP